MGDDSGTPHSILGKLGCDKIPNFAIMMACVSRPGTGHETHWHDQVQEWHRN